ncbi:dynamin family protein [Rhodotorula paludigena]|uniref:dynamin family protein n=1 Tax=Rhodotorula paludigena TaxID=86838 RepID=UPI00317C46A8
MTAPAEGIAATAYAAKRRQLVSLVDSLRSAGASAEVDLPRIAVIGNQSAGKSSLVEAISGIKVPRDAGTCTRCPTEVRLRSAATPWSCRVSLRFERDPAGRPLDPIREVPFGKALDDPNAVEATLRRAQLAILNPRIRDPSFFLALPEDEVRRAKAGRGFGGDSSGEAQLSFSTNVICLDISGPQVTDLAFVDLPGIIANSDEPDDITLIESMVREAITGNALILLTITMRDDYQNQKAVLLAREADPEGKRTIGVLTKADTLQVGEHAGWIDLLEGRRHQLANGFFVTKQPAPDDLRKNLAFTEARAAEVEFFRTQAPWNTLSLASKSRLGTSNLTKFLSDRLGQYIAEKLPAIQADLASSLAYVRTSLEALPPPPSSDPVTELHTRLSSLSHDLDLLVQGASGHADLVQLKNREDKRFKLAIKATRPVFVPFEDAQADKIKKWRAQNVIHPAASGGQLTATPAAVNTAKTAPAVEPLESALQAFSFKSEPLLALEEVSEEEIRVLADRAYKANQLDHYATLRRMLGSHQADLSYRITESEAQGRAGLTPPTPDPAVQQAAATSPTPHGTRSKISFSLPPAPAVAAAPGLALFEPGQFSFTPPTPKPAPPPAPTFGFYDPSAPNASLASASGAAPPPLAAVKQAASGEPLSAAAAPSIDMTLTAVRAHIEQHKGREVPLNTPYGAKSSLMRIALQNWPELTTEALARMREPVSNAVEELVLRNFGRAKVSELTSIAAMVVSDVLDQLFLKATSRLDDMLELETSPYTQNTHYFSTTRDDALASYKKARETAAPSRDKDKLANVLSALAAYGFSAVKEEDLARLHGADMFEEELDSAAQTCAYWKVAYKRIVDDVPRIIDFSVIRPLPSALSRALLQRLVAGGETEIHRLMSESPELAEERAELSMRKHRLEEAKKVLLAFGRTL